MEAKSSYGAVDRDPSAIASLSGSSHMTVAGVSMIEWTLQIAAS